MSGAGGVFLIAGDVSGDRQAGELARALRAAAPALRLRGAGGPALAAAGVEVCVDSTPTSAVGLLDALRHAPQLWQRYGAVWRALRGTRPDLVVLVDTEALALPIGVALRALGVPLVLYFPPQVWMWGRWRLAWLRHTARLALCTLPREAALYRAAGIDTEWVGHPLRDLVRTDGDGGGALAALGRDPGRPLVALMPGSRRRELDEVMPVILDAARALQARDPALQFAVPLAAGRHRPQVAAAVRARGLRDVTLYEADSYAVLGRARLVIQCSGTATLEAALLGVPAVIVYRCRPIEYLVARHLVMRVPHIGLPNILLDELVQPEFLQRDADAARVCEAAWALLTDAPRRAAIQRRLADVRAVLGPPGAVSRAAHAVLALLDRRGT